MLKVLIVEDDLMIADSAADIIVDTDTRFAALHAPSRKVWHSPGFMSRISHSSTFGWPTTNLAPRLRRN